MKLSELIHCVVEARMCGLRKIPGKGVWVKEYVFYECTARFYISNLELIYSKVPIQVILNRKYDEFWKQYQEKFGEPSFESLTINTKEEENK
jgi:hypothetical protein